MRSYTCAALSETLRNRGRELLKISVKYPVFDEYPLIDAFYADISSRCFEYAATTLAEEAGQRFTKALESRNVRRSAKRAAFYTVSCRVTRYDDELLSLYLDITQADEENVKYYRRIAQTWRLSDSRMLPLWQFVKLRGKNKQYNSDDFYLSGKSVILFTNSYSPGLARRRSQLPDFIKEQEIIL